MTNIIDYKKGLSHKRIRSLEKELTYSLPSEYKSFLLNFNGGYPEPDTFKIVDINDESTVDRFLSVGSDENSNFGFYLEIYKNRIPKNYIPIAHDPGGNLLLLCLNGKKRGEVFFWDHEIEVDEGKVDTSNVFQVAKNFEQFLNELYELEL